MAKFLKISVAILIISTILLSNISFADDINTGSYTNIYETPDGSQHFLEKAGGVLGVIQVVATAISVIMVSISAVKYMTSSIQEKASAKEQLILICIGALLLFGGTNILTIVAKWANSQS